VEPAWELVFEVSDKFGITWDGSHWWLTDPRTSVSPVWLKYDGVWNFVDGYLSNGTGDRTLGAVFYDGALWAATRISGCRLDKYDPSDLSLLDRNDSTLGSDVPGDVTVKDGHICLLRRPLQLRELKVLEPSDLSVVDTIAMPNNCQGVEWRDSNWYVARAAESNPDLPTRISVYDEAISEEQATIETPELFTALEIVGTFLYAVGESGVWRRSLI
jgi:hypothetical protein